MSYREVRLADLAPNVIFWASWDGKVDGQRVYAPRCTYWKREDGRIVECCEFGRTWSQADCGLLEDTIVGTIGQPIR